jgi:dipeptidyl aminopeptidase/acylaminoacyl peptidase
MLVWVVLPPISMLQKKYPTLLYCQGGPQSALTQFYFYRWNLQLMAANGYIVVALNRRGMPGGVRNGMSKSARLGRTSD